MNKIVKKVIIGVLIAAAAVGAVFAGLTIFKNASREPVKVFCVSDFSVSAADTGMTSASGMVTADRIQNVMISETQKITEIYVKEGQTVKEGDPLIAFDTTLSDIDLEKADIAYQRQQMDLENMKKDLQKINSLSPHSTVLVTPPSKGIVYTPHETPAIISGTGTQEDPVYILWGKDDMFSQDYLMSLVPEIKEPETSTEVFAAFVTRQDDALNAPIESTFCLNICLGEKGLTFKPVELTLSDDILAFEKEDDPYYKEEGSAYTASEIAQMKKDKQAEIKDAEINLKLAEVELKRLQQEVNDGKVYARFEGEVVTLRDENTAFMEGRPLIEVSGGGGYIIECAVSEMELEKVMPGSTVTITSWMNGMTYEGTVTEVSPYPVSSQTWSEGNNNASFYPAKISVSADAELLEGDYVGITYNSQTDGEDGFYLDSIFIRTESGRSYVFIQGEDGLLTKRYIRTGKSLWGSYLEIKDGLTREDYAAFPYGDDVVEGAATIPSSQQEFYSF